MTAWIKSITIVVGAVVCLAAIGAMAPLAWLVDLADKYDAL